MTPKDILQGAREMLGPKGENWGREFYIKKRDDGTCCFCILGALHVAAGVDADVIPHGRPYALAVGLLTKMVDHQFIGDWNDEQKSFETVDELLNSAIWVASRSPELNGSTSQEVA